VMIDSAEQLCYKVLGFSSPHVDYRESVISAKGKRVEGTCEWIRGHESYHAWLNGDISLLWISGGPGKGKTMMSIFLTEDLEQKIPTMENTQLVHFFFSFQDENRNTGVTLLQSLIYQIVTKRPQLKTHLLPYLRPGNSQQPELSFEPLWAIFKKIIQDPELGNTLCVLDGIDESDKGTTQILLPRLVDLLSPTLQPPLSITFRLIVVSRDISGLENCTRIKLDPDNNESVHDDIEKFISIRVRDLSKVVGSRHRCEIEVQSTLLQRAEGTFLWVGFAMYELMRKRTWTEVFDALKTLPSGLPAIYSRMLHQIPPGHRKISSKILQWVTMAFRPLTLLEIAIAIGLKSLSSSISLKHAIMDEITLCSSFLKVHNSEVTLIHQSVRDYLLDEKQHNNPVLEAFQIKPNEAHFEMAQNCLQCIEQSTPQHRPLSMWSEPGEPPLLRYAAEHWLEHAASCSDLAAGLFDATYSFFTQNHHVRDKWWEIYRHTTSNLRYCYKIPPLLHIACATEIVPWVEIMIHENCSNGSEHNKMLLQHFLNQRNKEGKTALHYTASAGNFLLLKLLIRSGADVSAHSKGKTVLHSAARSRQDSGKIVQFLLDHGAEIDLPDIYGETALHKAIGEGNRQIVRTLLDKGASLGWVKSSGSTALHIAAISGDVDTVQLLLDRGANLEAVDSHEATALHIAASNGDLDIVQLLLDRGANLEAVDYNGSTALHIAASSGEVDTVQLLLDKGANLEAVDYNGLTALHIAASSGDVDTVQLLLNKGANLEAVDYNGLTVLHVATKSGKVDTVQLLLHKGADPEAVDYNGSTALHCAVVGRNVDTIQLLLDKGTSLERVDCEGSTALHIAIWSEEIVIVQLLLGNGADIHAKNHRGETVLHLATFHLFLQGSQSGMSDIVQLLLDRGADVDARNNRGKTAFDNPGYFEFLEGSDETVEKS
jgi:ankyrin repeat protein